VDLNRFAKPPYSRAADTHGLVERLHGDRWRRALAPSLAINPVGIGDSGSYDVTVALSCSSTIATSAAATPTVHPPIEAVDASIAGPANVCTTCLGGIASEAHTGGGAVTHQWGFRARDGPVKGFVFPDRVSPTNDAYFATDTKVWGVSETGAALVNKYAGGIPLPGAASPSIALFHTGSPYVCVGGGNGGARRGERLRDRLRISAVRPAVHDDSPALHADLRRRGGVRALKPAGLVRRE